MTQSFIRTIGDMIPTASRKELEVLTSLIVNSTLIGVDHDSFNQLWKNRLVELGIQDLQELDISDHIAVQKAIYGYDQNQAQDVDLDDLESLIHSMIGLLSNRQPGLMSWNKALLDGIDKLHIKISQIIGS